MHRYLPAVAVVLAALAPAPAQDVSPAGLFTNVGEDAVPRSTAADQGVRIACDPVDTLAGPRAWATAEYLLWYTRPQNVPLLVGSIPDAQAQVGQQLPPDTPITPLFPTGRRVRFDAQNGVRVRAGANLTDLFGVDAGGFALEGVSDGGVFSSPGSPSLVRTYTRALDGVRQLLYSALPGSYPGSVGVFADTQAWGADANARFNWFRVFADRTDLLAGVRYLNLTESLVIHDRSDLAGGTVVNTVLDAFRTSNQVYAGQVGFHSRFSGGRFTLEVADTFGLGGARQRVQVFGNNTLTGSPDEPTGLYTQAGLTGTFERNRFVATNDFNLTVGCRLTPRVRAHVGYNILWVSSVVRPGLAIDPVINDSGIRFVANPEPDPNGRRPVFEFDRASSDLWLQGVNLGLTIGF